MQNTWQATRLPYRQAQVIEDMANGMTYDECAEHRGISRSVVNGTIQTLFYKFGLSRGNKAKLVAEAIRQGVLTSTAAMLVICVLVNMMAGIDGWQARRNSSRLNTRITRTVRLRGRDQLIEDDLQDITLPPADDESFDDAGGLITAEHHQQHPTTYSAECRTISGKLILVEGRTPAECKAALLKALTNHATALVA
ncbi:MAG: hypothetical protein MK185_06730 [Saccharospirillaceae bacterium]|nr:hypothetical protein [Saccharospirillaceae bacterium]